MSTVVLTMPARPVKFTRYCLTQWISKQLRSFEIHWVRQYLVNVVLSGIKDLQTSEITYVGPEYIFPNYFYFKYTISDINAVLHDYLMTCICLVHYWTFVLGIHQLVASIPFYLTWFNFNPSMYK